MKKSTPTFTATDQRITRITSWLAILILLFLIYKGTVILFNMYRYEETNDAQVQEYINPVTTRISGYIREIRYEENQQVAKGDTLIIIERNEFDAKKDEAREAVNNAHAQLGVLESNIETAEKLAEVSNLQIGAAKARLTRAKQDFTRYSRLLNEESATGQQLESKKEMLDVSTSEYTSALGNYQAALSKINDYRSQKSGINAEIKRRMAVQHQSELDLSYTVITAPYRGKISRKTIQEGQYVQANQPLANIVNGTAGKWVIANFKETQIAAMHDGQDVLIETDAYPGQQFKGRIASFAPGTGSSFSLLPPDNATGNFVKVVQRIPVKIVFATGQHDQDLLRSGMNATVKVIR